MAKKKSIIPSKSQVTRKPYLTKRILISVARNGVKKASEETMRVMGYTVIASGGWVIKKYADGRTEQISPIPVSKNQELILD
jgi:hypothetical protein